jgi:hypothetical protein
MRRILALVLVTVVVTGGIAVAQEHPAEPEHPSTPEYAMDQDAMMQAWLQAARPGEMHAFLAMKAGTWHLRSRMWMQPGADPMETESVAEAEMILGGRFLMERITGESMGGPFEGLSIMGYDNSTGMVTNIWYDTMGTMTTISTGRYGKAGDPLVLTGSMLDVSSGVEMGFRSVTTFVDDDHATFEYFMSMPGAPEMRSMVIEYTRAR